MSVPVLLWSALSSACRLRIIVPDLSDSGFAVAVYIGGCMAEIIIYTKSESIS